MPQKLAEERRLEKDLPKDVLFSEIPKPEGEFLPTKVSINDEITLIDDKSKKVENTEETLKKVFEDAEFILDELFPDKEPDDFGQSQPIIKPSESL